MLDATAISAYAAGSEHVGEVLREFADEHVPFGLPVACLIEARVAIPDSIVATLDLLIGLPLAVPLPLEVSGWRQQPNCSADLDVPVPRCRWPWATPVTS